MQVPHELTEWLEIKLALRRAGVKQSRTVHHSWRRHMGPRSMSAGIAASIEPSEEFLLRVEASAIEPDYIAGARDGVITVLLSQGATPILACTITLFEFKPHEVESSYSAFYSVAKEATQQLLGVAPGFDHNIAW
jgi:hypothetical protein